MWGHRRFRARGGAIEVRLPAGERALLARLPEMLDELTADPSGPAARRLSPEAYPDDTEAQREFGRLTRSDLDEGRRADRTRLSATLDLVGDRGVIDPEDAEAWIRVIGEARLALAANGGLVREEAEWAHLGREEAALVQYLGLLQHELAEALLEQEER